MKCTPFHMFYFTIDFFLFLRPKCSLSLALFIFWQTMNSFISTRLVYGVLFLQHCGGLTLAGHQVPCKQLYHTPPPQDKAEEKIKPVEKKPHVPRQRQFNKAKTKATNKGEQNIYSLLPINRWCQTTSCAVGTTLWSLFWLPCGAVRNFSINSSLTFGTWGWGGFVFLKKCLFVVVNCERFYILAHN